MKPYPKYKPSGIQWLGDVPEHWKISRGDELFTLSRVSISKEELLGKTVIHYSIPAIQEFGKGILEEGNTIDSNKLIIKGNEVIISKLNPRKETVLITSKHDDFLQVCSSEFIVLIPRSIDLKFGYYLYKSHVVKETICSCVQSATKSHQRANPDDIYKIHLPCPPLPEQRSIANFLDRKTEQINALIANKQRLIALLQEERTAVINRAVTRGINPDAPTKHSGVDWLGDVPEHWEVKKLKYIASYLNGYAFKSDEFSYQGIPVIRIGDIQPKIDLNETKKISEKYFTIAEKFIINKGDILLALTGATIGKSTVYTLDEVALLNQRVGILRPNQYISNDYLFAIIRSSIFKEHIQIECDGGAQENIGKEEVGKFLISLPPLPEQHSIVAHIERETARIDRGISLAEREIELLSEYRTALINAVVTGKVRVAS